MEFSQATELSLLPRRREERVAQTDKSIPWLSSISHLPPPARQQLSAPLPVRGPYFFCTAPAALFIFVCLWPRNTIGPG